MDRSSIHLSKVKTKVAKGSLNPTFNETLQMNVDDPEEPILVEVKDWNFASNISMGKAKIYLNECKAMELKEMRLALENVSRGAMHVSVTWCPLSS